MTARSPDRGRPREPRSDASRWPDRLERFALYTVLAVLALRPCIQETSSFESPSWTRSLDAPGGPGPATTIVLSLVIVAAGACALMSRWLRGTGARPAVGVWPGMLLLCAASVIATVAAGQRRIALNGSLSLLGEVAVFPIMASLLKSQARRRLALCVVLASGAAFAAKVIYQVHVELPQTREYFEQHRGEWAAAAGPDGQGRLYDFEQRLRSNTGTGYFVHANAAASYLLLIVNLALAAAIDRWRRRTSAGVAGWGPPALVCALSLAAIYYCGSKGAAGALVLTALVWLLAARFGLVIEQRPRSVLTGLWLATTIMAGGVLLIGVLRGGLPTRSLLYRWQYWRGADQMIREHGWWGIGPENFGRLFTRYKPVECPEEVQDPHGWPVRLAVEWGALGLVAMLAVFAVAARWMVAPRAMLPPDDSPPRVTRSVLSLAAAMFAGWWWIHADAPIDYVLLTLLMPAAIWPLTALGCGVEFDGRGYFADEPIHSLRVGAAAGSIGFAVHTAIDLGMFVPGAASTFFAVLALGTSDAAAPSAVPSRARPRLAAAAGIGSAAALIAAFGLLVAPAAEYARQLATARMSARPGDWDTYVSSASFAAYARAAEIDRLDSTAAAELIAQLLPRVRRLEHTEAVRPWIEQLAKRDRFNATAERAWASLFALRFSLTNDAADMSEAIAHMRRAIEAYPTLPTTRIMLAQMLVRLYRAAPDAELLSEAAAEISAALKLDEQRIYISRPHRLSPERRAELSSQVDALRSGSVPPGFAGPVQTAPASSSAAQRSS